MSRVISFYVLEVKENISGVSCLFLFQTTKEMIARCSAVVISQPFHGMCVFHTMCVMVCSVQFNMYLVNGLRPLTLR